MGCEFAQGLMRLFRNPLLVREVELTTETARAVGAADLSPVLQRWERWKKGPSPVGTTEGATPGLKPPMIFALLGAGLKASSTCPIGTAEAVALQRLACGVLHA